MHGFSWWSARCWCPIPCNTPRGADGYRALLAEALSGNDLANLRLYLQQPRAYSRDAFRETVEAKTQRFAGVRPAHRPAKTKSITETG